MEPKDAPEPHCSRDHTGFVPQLTKDLQTFVIGDLIWARVKSHPWWPGQVFDVAYASDRAKMMEKSGTVLISFFGDYTFAWLEHSQILPLRPHFEEKAKAKALQAQSFEHAVFEVLFEVCKRAELGLECACRKWILQFDHTLNGVRQSAVVKRSRDVDNVVEHHKDVTTSKELFDVRKTLDFLRTVAHSPCDDSLTLTVEASLCQGHALGVRNGLFAQRCKATLPTDGCIVYRSRKLAEKRNTREGETTVSNRSQCPTQHMPCQIGAEITQEFFVEESGSVRRGRIVAGLPEDNGGPVKTLADSYVMVGSSSNYMSDSITEGSHMSRAKVAIGELARGFFPSLSSCQKEAASKLMQILKALQTLARDPLCDHHIPPLLAGGIAALFKFRASVFEKSPDYGAACQGPKEGVMPHAQNMSAISQCDPRKVLTEGVRHQQPASQKRKMHDSACQQPLHLHKIHDSAHQRPPHLHQIPDCARQQPDSQQVHVSAYEEPPKMDLLRDNGDKQPKHHSRQNLTMQPRPKPSSDCGNLDKAGTSSWRVPSRCEQLDVHELLLRVKRQRCEMRK